MAVLLLTLPLIALYLNLDLGALSRFVWAEPFKGEISSALRVTFLASGVAVTALIITGVPLAYVLARYDFPGRNFLEGLVDLPLVIPHAVSGIMILAAFGGRGLLGPSLTRLGVRVEDAFLGVVAVMLFVSAPLLIDTVKVGFSSIEEDLIAVARSLGASRAQTFLKVELPLAGKHIATGALMAWARGLSEVGALLIVAYYPKTINVLILEYFNVFGLKAALALSAVYLTIILAAFTLIRKLLVR